MPGRRLSNFRDGDRAEGLAVEMLRAFAFVAPIPRPEDVGLDALATLCVRDGPMLYADKSFYVQFKASSKKAVRYAGHECEWFFNQRLPVLLGTLDLKRVECRLYTTQAAYQPSVWRKVDQINLHLRPRPEHDQRSPHDVYLGSPIISWTPWDGEKNHFRELGYRILKAHIDNLQRNLALAPLGYCRTLEWDTNEEPRRGKDHFSGTIHDRLHAISPQIEVLALSLAFDPELSLSETANTVADFVHMMESMDLDPIPNDNLEDLRVVGAVIGRGTRRDEVRVVRTPRIAPTPEIKLVSVVRDNADS